MRRQSWLNTESSCSDIGFTSATLIHLHRKTTRCPRAGEDVNLAADERACQVSVRICLRGVLQPPSCIQDVGLTEVAPYPSGDISDLCLRSKRDARRRNGNDGLLNAQRLHEMEGGICAPGDVRPGQMETGVICRASPKVCYGARWRAFPVCCKT